MAKTEYDVLIIGSGAAGGTAAWTLTQKGAKCLMLDAGPLVDLQRVRGPRAVYDLPYRGFGKPGRLPHVTQASEFNANQWADEVENPYTHREDSPYNWVRVRMVGGKSLFWGRMSFRLSDYEFRGKDHDGFGENWPVRYADLAPYYDRIEPILRVTGLREGYAQLPDGKFIEDKAGWSGSMQRLIDAASKRGVPLTKVRRALGQGQFASPFNLLVALTYDDWRLAFFILGVTVSGGGQLVYAITQLSYRQAVVPSAILGRVNATMRFLVMGALPIGGLLGGGLGAVIGVRRTLLILALGLAVAPIFVVLSSLRRVRDVSELAARPQPLRP